MVDVPYLLLDVFTQTQFEGNPLAVVIDPPPLTDGQMANIAREFNLSETIFLGGVGGGRWTTRIFTPAHELPFAGHPTVGGAIALALFGTILVYLASSSVLGEGMEAMAWSVLVQRAAAFDPALLNLAFVFLLLDDVRARLRAHET